MNSLRLSWGLLLFWSAWAQGLSGFLGSEVLSPRWAPDLGLLLVLSLDARVPRELAWRVACVVALARIATSAAVAPGT